jgi:preprotein translocase SecE subunit
MTIQRYTLLVFVTAGLLASLLVQAAAVDAFVQLSMTDDRLLGLVNTSTLLAALAGFGSFFALLRNVDAVRFTGEVIGELVKVTWPTRDETMKATTTVVFTTLFVAALLGVYDFLWKNVADLFLFSA